MSDIFFDNHCLFVYEEQAFPGVNKVANHVKHDISLITGSYPSDYIRGDKCKNLVIFGTIGKSEFLDDLDERGIIKLDLIRGKWEVFSFQIVDNPIDGVSHALIIAGSDKRGTIYGLYHLSELLGVSPLVTWNHVIPRRREDVYLTDAVNKTSKEPSVKYRGFFINDEWPAFGNWSERHFGGINAKCYERVFELLLRLKGNYLWPAMWNSNFSMDGPGLESARLADEYGIVMSTSHHEPCMRSGEEYTLLRGKDSTYGDAWDFRINKQGITRFWKDGLIRNKLFENVITIGMRGEQDSAILGKEATLEDNISLLRDVLKTQNKLIKETICDDLDQVPRQLVLFTEVEEFFYGNEDVKGLMGDPELDGITLILSDNNFGYTRTLPTDEMRNHKGGYGMYYHMDMHGGAYSYQWIGSTYLPRVWEQMTQAYDYGVREIWVTNIGDIATQEYGLSFFLDLAYDIDKWGGQDPDITVKYTKEWVDKQFGGILPPSKREIINRMIWDYTGMLAKRKHEIMNAHIYHPLHFGEAENILKISEELLINANSLKKSIEEANESAFISLIYYPVCGTANLMKMWILAGRNKLFASQNRIEANLLAEQIDECVREDEALIAEYEHVDNGYYNGFGLSDHIGFTNWNDEDNKYPIRHYIYGAKQPRMLVSRINDEHYMTGLFWCDKPQIWRDALRADVNTIEFDLSCGSDKPFEYIIKTDCKWMSFSKTSGTVDIRERIVLKINRELFQGRVEGEFSVTNVGYGEAIIEVEAENREAIPAVFMENDSFIAIDAIHYNKKEDTGKGGFRMLTPYGRSGRAIKVFPSTVDFLHKRERPFVEYQFWANKKRVFRLCFYMTPTTPVVFEREQYIGYSINEEAVQIMNTVEKPEIPFFLSPQWEREAMDNIKLVKTTIECRKGINKLRFYGMSPAIILEKIVLHDISVELPESYLGPNESFIQY